MQFKDKVALVTGGTSGIGAATTARRFAREGAWTFVLGRNRQNGEEVVREILETGGKAHFVACDVSDDKAIRESFQALTKEAGTLNILFNCAGVAPVGTLEEVCTDLWSRAFALNVESMFHLSKLAVPVMRRSGSGVIINVSSSAGTVGAWGCIYTRPPKVPLSSSPEAWLRFRTGKHPCELPVPGCHDNLHDGAVENR